MPDIDADGCKIHVEVEGPEGAPVLMLSNSLGTDLSMWDAQEPAFTRHFRLVRYDRRGHGRSGVPQGPYTMERLGRDALAVLDALGIVRVNWCGLSMGGMVGQWLGANAPGRIDKLILSNTASYYADKQLWADRMRFARNNGIAAVAAATMERWFTKDFRERAPEAIARMTAMFVKTDIEGYLGCCAAIRDMNFREWLPRIEAPTLVIAGRADPATPIEMNTFISDRIPGAKLAVIEAAHIANVEQPQAYTDTVLGFLLRT
jgi:3-oxoadipate enol-lactonase